MKKDFKLIVLGSDENAYCDARLLYEAYGEKPLALCEKQIDATTYTRLITCKVIPNFRDEAVFCKELKNVLDELKNEYEKLLVIPCVDYYAALLVRNIEKFDGLIANRFPSKELFEKIYSKVEFYTLCEKYGLNYPGTLILSPTENGYQPEKPAFDYPFVMKPENSLAENYINCNLVGKDKVFYLKNETEYKALIDRFNASDYRGKLVLQEYISGGDDAIWMVNAYADTDGTVSAVAVGQALLDEYAPAMRGNNAIIISRVDQEISEKVTAFLQGTGYRGFANFDIKKDAKTGRTVFFEVNPRLGRTHMFVRAAGLNMMKVLVDDVVYGMKKMPETASQKGLFLNVLPYVLRKYVKNPKLRKEAQDLIRADKHFYARWDRKDMNLRRFFKLARHEVGLIRAYKKYFYETIK